MEPDEYERIAAAEDGHWWYRNTRRLIRDLLGPSLRPGMSILDAGCGPGGNSAWLMPEHRVTGIDVEPLAVRLARERHPGMEVREANVTELPFEDDSFDAVLVTTVLAIVGNDTAAVAEIARVLRPGGSVLCIEPANPRLRRAHDDVVHGHRRYRLPCLEDLFRSAGLEVRRATHAYSFLVPPAFLLALANRIRTPSPGDATSDLERDRLAWLFAPLAALERRILQRTDVPTGLSAVVLASAPQISSSSASVSSG